jgi:hypothetical protein
MTGQIYILINPTIPGLVKVGKTTGDAHARAGALSGATGVAAPFQIFKAYAVTDCDAAEKFAHRVLERTTGRPNMNREFFHGPPETVREILDDALAQFFRDFAAEATALHFEGAYTRVSRKEFTFACLEFEEAFRGVGSDVVTYKINDQLKKALGAYLACCVAISREPILAHVITDPTLKSALMDVALNVMRGWSCDPASDLIDYMRRLS